MYPYRVTKYNPLYRNEEGAFLRDDWISIEDIGNVCEGTILSYDEYINVENAYVQAVMLFMDCLKLNTLTIMIFEKHIHSIYSQPLLETYNSIYKRKPLTRKEIQDVIRLCLRGDMWCRLEDPQMYVHFSYDYYMYVGTIKPCITAIKKIEQLNLFVEECESPDLETLEELEATGNY